MKTNKIVCIVLSVCLLILCGCGSNSVNVSADGYGNPDEFLEDMAKGISQRLKNVDDEKERTDEELYEYYKQLVKYELDQVEKYENVTFEDELFNELAHEYIMGCKAQMTAAENYKKLIGLFSSGSSIRSNIITYMYEEYDLPITSEEAAHYSSSGSGTVTYTITSGSTNTEDEFDAEAVRSKLKAAHINGQGKYGLGATLIKNESTAIIEVNYTVKYYQGSSLVGTKDGTIDNIYPGETGAGWEIDYDYTFTKTEVDINSVSRAYWPNASEFPSLSDIVTYKTSISAGNAVIEVTNNGNNKQGYFEMVIVFYDGKVPVDVNYKNLEIDIGHTGTASIECKNDSYFDNVEVYFMGIY